MVSEYSKYPFSKCFGNRIDSSFEEDLYRLEVKESDENDFNYADRLIFDSRDNKYFE